MFYLPDTNVLIHSLSGKEPYSSWFVKNMEEKRLILSSITVAEFLSGAHENEKQIFNRILEKIEVVPVDKLVAKIGAEYRKRYTRKSKKVWLFDCLIAASCKVYGATLITKDKKDFPMKDIEVIQNFKFL